MPPSSETATVTPPKPDDFISHLRLINFTLLIASVGLAIAATVSSDQYREANRDLNEIISIANEDLAQQFKKYAGQVSSLHPRPIAGKKATYYVPLFTGQPRLARVSLDDSYLLPRSLRGKLPSLLQAHEPRLEDPIPFLAKDHRRITTLDEFQRLWNFFDKPPQPVKLLLLEEVHGEARVHLRRARNQETGVVPVFTTPPSQAPLIVYDLSEKRSQPPVKRPGKPFSAAAFLPGQAGLVVAVNGRPSDSGGDGVGASLQMWSMESLSITKTISLPGTASIRGLASSPDGKLVAALSSGFDGRSALTVWTLSDFKEVGTRDVPRSSPNEHVLVFSPDSKGLLVVCEAPASGRQEEDSTAKTLSLLRVQDLKPSPDFAPAPADYRAAAFAPDGKIIAVMVAKSSAARDLMVLNGQNGSILHERLGRYNRIVSQMKFLANGKTLVVASYDGSVKLWETTSPSKSRELLTGISPIKTVDISLDGKTLAAGGFDMRVHLWDLSTTQQVHKVLENEAMIQALGFVGGGNLVSVSSSVFPDLDAKTSWLEDVNDGSKLVLHSDLSGGAFPIAIEIPVRASAVDFDFREYLNQRVRENRNVKDDGHEPWPPQSFEKAFSSLNTVTLHLQTSALDDLKQHLDEEKLRAGEKFEAIGLKIPAEFVVRYGLFVLLGLQLYFWIHLAAFRKYCIPPQSLSLQPWIGLYDGLAARSAFFVSAVLVPIASSLVLTACGWHNGSNLGKSLFVVSVLVSGLLSYRIAREIIRSWQRAAASQATNAPALSHEAIAERARQLWEREGRPAGRDEYFWFRAIADLSPQK
jgi:WD40 repeat protein